MPVFDTPITTDEASLDRVLGQDLPVVLYLFNKSSSKIDKALKRVAKANEGEILVVQVDANANPAVHERFNRLKLPALLTLDEGEIESEAASIRAADVYAHVDFLLGEGPLPTETEAETEAREASGAVPVHVTDQSFQRDVLSSDVPVLVDFWAAWCGPCHMIAPSLEALAEEYAGQIKIAKLNVDENRAMAMQFGAMSIPLLLMFVDGKVVNKMVGAHPKQNIEAMIRSTL